MRVSLGVSSYVGVFVIREETAEGVSHPYVNRWKFYEPKPQTIISFFELYTLNLILIAGFR